MNIESKNIWEARDQQIQTNANQKTFIQIETPTIIHMYDKTN